MTGARLQRDRLIAYGYLNIAAYCWTLYGLGPALLLLRDETGMSRTLSSLHSTATALGVLLVGVAGPKVFGGLGRARSAAMGTVSVAASAVIFSVATSVWMTMPAAFLMGAGGSMTINAFNAFYSARHGAASAAAIGESNAIAVLAGLLSPLVLGSLVAAGMSWRIGMALPLIPLLIGLLVRGDTSEMNQRGEEHPHAQARLPRDYWWAWFTVTLCIAVEFAYVLWSGDLLRAQAQVSTAVAAGGLSAVAIGMMIGRFSIGLLLRRFALDRLFRASLLLPLVAWVPMWLTHDAVVMLASMLVIGIGLGYHFPLSMSRMLVAAPGLADEAAMRSSIASGIAIGGSPFVLALLANQVGLHAAFVMVPVLLVIALVSAITHPVRT